MTSTKQTSVTVTFHRRHGAFLEVIRIGWRADASTLQTGRRRPALLTATEGRSDGACGEPLAQGAVMSVIALVSAVPHRLLHDALFIDCRKKSCAHAVSSILLRWARFATRANADRIPLCLLTGCTRQHHDGGDEDDDSADGGESGNESDRRKK